LVEIIKIFTAGGIISQDIISIQTTDEKTLEVINRKNIKTEIYRPGCISQSLPNSVVARPKSISEFAET